MSISSRLLWNYCNVLRDDWLSYGDYLEELTYLLFLKMADEQTKPPFSTEPSPSARRRTGSRTRPRCAG